MAGRYASREVVGSLLVVVLTAAALVVVMLRLSSPISPIDTDILALVPHAERDPVLAAAIERAGRLVADRVTLVLDHAEGVPPTVAADLVATLRTTGLFVPLDDEAAGLWRWLFDHRDRLLCPADRAMLERGDGAILAAAAVARMQAPLVPLPAAVLRADPLLLSLRLVECFTRAPGHARDKTLVVGRLTGSAFALDVQDRAAEAIERWQLRHAGSGIELVRAGALFRATAAAATARVEIARVGILSLVVIVLVLMALFANLWAALLALFSILLGVLGGLGACLALFSKVHALTLLFGAAMTGIGVDYAIHVMVAGLPGHNADMPTANPAHSIARPLSVGLLTTLAAFACLLLFGVELMKQVAVFGGAGLLLSFGFSRFVLCHIYRRPKRIAASAALVRAFAGRLLGWQVGPAFLWPAAVVLLAVGWGGWQRLAPTDDVRAFQAPPRALLVEEQKAAAVAGLGLDTRFLLVRATDHDALVEAEMVAVAGLDHPLPAPSWLDPSPEHQAETRRLLERRLWSTELAAIAGMLGLDPVGLYQTSATDGTSPGLPSALAQLRGSATGATFSIVPLDPRDAQKLARTSLAPGTELVDPASVYGKLLARLRGQATAALALAFAAAALGLLAMHRKLADLALLLPAGLALLLVPAIAGLAGQTFSLFSIMGLLMALGLGIDYAAFLVIDRTTATAVRPLPDPWREAGILAAAVTTIAPMAALAFSVTLPVAHFGFACALGSALCLILSPLACIRPASNRVRSMQ